jgi:hypothetical protein
MMEAHDFQRRAVLHGTLAAGAMLMLFGCKAKQQEEGAAGTQPSPAPLRETPPAPQTSPSPVGQAPAGSVPSTKMSKVQAQYQEQPKGDKKCANCINFIADSNTCKLVEGQISPEGWCILWTGRS